MDEEFLRAGGGNLNLCVVSQCLILTGFEASGSSRLGCACALLASRPRRALRAVAPGVVQMGREEKPEVARKNLVCCSSPGPGAPPELWMAVPVQEHNSVFAAGDFRARLRTAAVQRKPPPLHHRLHRAVLVVEFLSPAVKTPQMAALPCLP